MRKNKKSKLDKIMDSIKQQEESGIVKNKLQNRVLNKFFNNKLALIGLVVFTFIVLATIFAPLICRYHPGKIDVINALQPPSAKH
ncbi:MAG TPA: peptide ABC transporter permease, partial [Firmicutes bacterium]|nr:peptide ABC transporter permease [Bacillota bacterium]